jgi:hypothetical protein
VNRLLLKLSDVVSQQESRINIFDASGRLLKEVIPPLGSDRLEIAVDDFSSGIYFIQLWTDEARRYTARFVKL